MSQNNRSRGSFGEELAVTHLKKKGYIIRHCNWFFGHKELDIVAEKDNMLIIVEVKSRTSDLFAHPEEAVSRSKIRSIIDATEAYIDTYNLDMDVRFDVISVLFQPNKAPEIEHFDDAFLPPLS